MTDETPSILIIEDDASLRLGLEQGFLSEGYAVESAADGEQGLKLALEGSADLIILDLMLPRVDGFEILRRVRADRLETPVIVLTARGEEEDRIAGFEYGADDYVVKPFSVRELLLRRGEERIGLSRKEADMLRLFLESPGEVISRQRFLESVWGYHSYPTTRTVDMHVLKLRQKIEPDTENPRHILTVHGVGYKFMP